MQEQFANQMLKGAGEFFQTSLIDQQVKDWYEYQKTTNQFADIYLEEAKTLNYYMFSLGPVALGISTYWPLTEIEINLFKRFRNVFELAYRRFTDIQKAEAQAREAQIQLALERVRSRAMAMHHSEELFDLLTVLIDQFDVLGICPPYAHISIIDKATHSFTFRISGSVGNRFLAEQVLDIDASSIWKQAFDNWEKGEYFTISTHQFPKEILPQTWQMYNNLFSTIPEDHRAKLEDFPNGLYVTEASCKFGFLGYGHSRESTVEEKDIIVRFTKEFEQSYTRFLDLQKAEAQAREAQIQLALERVRARTMAMQKSEELAETAAILFEQFIALGEMPERMAIEIVNEAEHVFEIWATEHGGKQFNSLIKTSLDEPYVMQKMYRAWKDRTKSITIDLQGNELEGYFQFLKKLKLPVDRKIFGKRRVQNVATFSRGILTIITPEPRPRETIDILERFAAVFDGTYTRFLDLQKAEAQARESQIEAALERVRSKTMAMHNSQDVGDTVATMFDELVKLGIETNRCGILIFGNTMFAEVWTARSNPEGKATLIIGQLDLTVHPLLTGFHQSWKKKEQFFTYPMLGDDLVAYYQAINDTKYYPTLFNMEDLPSREFHSDFYFEEGSIFAFTAEPIPSEAAIIFKRFAGVFGQTYRRYLDLQKAEAQAREATIEAALEKVRGRAMAMQNSDDVSAAASTVFTEIRNLGIGSIRCGVGLLSKHSRKAIVYAATTVNGNDALAVIGDIDLSGHVSYDQQYEAWLNQENCISVLKGAELKTYYEGVNRNFKLPAAKNSEMREIEYGYYFSFSEGLMYSWSEKPYTENEVKILNRFKSIIDLTFRRYIELQKAEVQARKAIKASSLDRVRAEIASMRSVDDLQRITPLIWHELIALGVPFIRCGVFIINESTKHIQVFLSAPDGKSLAAMDLPFDSSELTINSVDYWRKGLIFKTHWNKEQFLKWMQSMVSEGQVKNTETYQGTLKPPESLDLHFVPFAQGMLYVGNVLPLTIDELDLVRSLAEAFAIAYARYEDFKKLEIAKKSIETTLSDLKAAQSQLVQSEKMASLGELTAGIAHEIQNPLNFVNNFSEVSTELVDEMKDELAAGNWQLATELADDVKQNLEKINHHGKRADAIVKGMLQHSRSSTGQKEPTDINALAAEYLRLAYHGLRAKDKSFNATMNTDFDESIGKINIIPQDIGRVILNLITNAFYAANIRITATVETRHALSLQPPTQSIPQPDYKPTVNVSTKKMGSHVEIRVKDNGSGIPANIVDKIFQPFFTTKPTGQGTGLGLSLAYDIVKAHGGELKVETKEGEGTEFTIQLPVV